MASSVEEERDYGVAVAVLLGMFEGAFCHSRLARSSLAFDPEKPMVIIEQAVVTPPDVFRCLEEPATGIFQRRVNICNTRVHVVEAQSFYEVRLWSSGPCVIHILVLNEVVAVMDSCVVLCDTIFPPPASSWLTFGSRHVETCYLLSSVSPESASVHNRDDVRVVLYWRPVDRSKVAWTRPSGRSVKLHQPSTYVVSSQYVDRR